MAKKRRAARHAKTPEFKPAQRFTRGSVLSLKTDLPLVTSSDFVEISDPKKALYLQAVSQTPRLEQAARMAGIPTMTAYCWRKNTGADPLFDKWFPIARRLGLMQAEGELWRRGVDGFDKPVYHQGQLVGTERVFDTTAAIFMLKGALPEIYRERYEVTGQGGGPVQVETRDGLTDDELLRRAELVRAALAGRPAEPAVEAERVEPVDPELASYQAALARRRNGGEGNGGGA